MEIVKKSGTNAFSNSPTCSGFSYPLGSEALDIAVVTVNGRYPEKGHLVNEVSLEIAYVLRGDGSVGVDDQVHTLSPGDAVLINPGERFYWQGESLEMLMPCAPAFSPDQHKEVE